MVNDTISELKVKLALFAAESPKTIPDIALWCSLSYTKVRVIVSILITKKHLNQSKSMKYTLTNLGRSEILKQLSGQNERLKTTLEEAKAKLEKAAAGRYFSAPR